MAPKQSRRVFSTSRIFRSMCLLFLLGCTLSSAFTSSICKKKRSLALSAKRNLPKNSSNNNNVGVGDDDWKQAQRDVVRASHARKCGGLVWNRAVAIFASAVVTTSVLQPVPVSLAAPPTLNEAIIELSETSYPILRALDPTAFRDFTTKIGDLVFQNVKTDKLGKSIELGIDALDSAPPEKLADFNSVLKEAYAGVDTDSCKTAPLPPKSIVEKLGEIASESVDPDKLKAFGETWKPSLETLDKVKSSDDKAICLPASRASLDKLALAQADLARNFGKTETKAFVSYAGPVLKTSITAKKALSLVNDAKTLAPQATAQAKKEFLAAGKKAESASQLEIARNKVAEQKAKQAANRAAIASTSSTASSSNNQ